MLLRVDSRGGAAHTPLNGLRVTNAVSQTKTASGGLLVRLGYGSHAVSGPFGWVLPGSAYAIDFRLAGDVDGSFEVTPADLGRIRTGILTPTALTQQERARADVDGSGRIDDHDLRLAASNLWASTAVRPLELQAGIAAGTPSHQGVVHIASGGIAAATTPGAAVVFVNTATGERDHRAVVADGRSGSIWSFQSPRPITPPAGSVYHVRETLPAGDDMVPSVSLRATYAGDPRIVVRAWGNGTPGVGRHWMPTRGSVRHAEILGNRDVLAFIRHRLMRDTA